MLSDVFDIIIEFVMCMVCNLLHVFVVILYFFFFKQKTAYEMRISDWSSDVCSSDLSLDIDPSRLVLAGDSAGATLAAVTALRLRDEGGAAVQIGRASCRERVCQYVSISVVAASLKKKTTTSLTTTYTKT